MIVKCPKCGNIVSDRSAACPSCGEVLNTRPFAEKPKVEEKVAEVQETPLAQAAPVAEPAPEVQHAAQTQPAPAAQQPTPEVQPAPVAQPVPAVQPVPVAQPVPEKKKKSWKGLIWGSVAVLALAGILSLYTLAITKMGLETIKIEVHFYTRPTVTEPAPAVQDTTATAAVTGSETAQTDRQ